MSFVVSILFSFMLDILPAHFFGGGRIPRGAAREKGSVVSLPRQTRKWLEIHGEIEQKKEEALSLLAQKYPPGEHTNWKICEALEPHAQGVLKYHYATKRHRLERAEVLHNSAWYVWARGDYGKAKGRIQEAVETRKELLDTDDPETLNSLGLLALVLNSQGRWALHRRGFANRPLFCKDLK
jgi:hypothetical protein